MKAAPTREIAKAMIMGSSSEGLDRLLTVPQSTPRASEDGPGLAEWIRRLGAGVQKPSGPGC